MFDARQGELITAMCIKRLADLPLNSAQRQTTRTRSAVAQDIFTWISCMNDRARWSQWMAQALFGCGISLKAIVFKYPQCGG